MGLFKVGENQVIKNSIWSFVGTIGGQVINLIGNIILARMLYPQLFGLLGIATFFYSLILILQEVGFSAYIIYKKDLKKEYISSSFWLNIIFSTILTLIFLLNSTSLAHFYHEKELSIIIELLCLGMIFSAFGITSRAILIRNKKFDVLAKIDVTAQVISTSVAIIFAFCQLNYLAITAKFIVLPLIQSLFLFMKSYKNVIGNINWNVVKEVIPYSSKIFGTNLFIFFNNNIDNFMIGKFLGSRQLGLYSISYQWSVLARFYISGSINKVLFPEVSSNNSDIEKVKNIFINVTNTVSFLTFPFCLGLLAISSDFIMILYGSKWEESIKVLQILLMIGTITSIGTLSGSLFQGLGKPEVEFRFNIISFIFNAFFIFVGIKWGLLGVALSIFISAGLLEIYKIFILSKLINVTVIEYISSFLPNLFSSVIMSVATIIFNKILFPEFPIILRACISIIFGFAIYILVSFFINKQKLIEIVNITKRILVKKNQ